MLTDVAALGLSFFAVWFSSRPATAAKTYGFLRVEILAALINGAVLLVISLIIFYESYRRILTPPVVKSGMMLVIAISGLLINLICAYFLHNSQHTVSILGVPFLHVIGDAVSSVGAILAGILMLWREWYMADPLASFFVGGLILVGSWRLVKDSVNILLEGTPAHIDLTLVREELCTVKGVASIHDLHIWTLTSGIHAMSCHVVVSGADDRHKETSLRHTEMSSCH